MGMFLGLSFAFIAVVVVPAFIWGRTQNKRYQRYKMHKDAREQREAEKMAKLADQASSPHNRSKQPYNWQFGYTLIERLKPEETTFREILEAMTEHVSCDVHDRLRRMERAKHNLHEMLKIYLASHGESNASHPNVARCHELIQDLEDEMNILKTTHFKESHG